MDINQQLKKYRPLVGAIAFRLGRKLPANVHFDDLIQSGMIGLAEAITRFDAGQGVKFETFATQRVQGAMLDELRETDPMSRSLRRKQREFLAAYSKLEQRFGRRPLESEVAKELGLHLHEYQRGLAIIEQSSTASLEDLSEEGDPFIDCHDLGQIADPLEQLEASEMREALIEALFLLPEKLQLVYSLRYEEGLNLLEIGKVLGVSEPRAFQLHNVVVKHLKAHLTGHKKSSDAATH